MSLGELCLRTKATGRAAHQLADNATDHPAKGSENRFRGCRGKVTPTFSINQLKAWKEGKRSNDPLNLMTGVVSRLSDKEIEAVAAYFASLPASPQQGAKP
jgi:cytochrome c553